MAATLSSQEEEIYSIPEEMQWEEEASAEPPIVLDIPTSLAMAVASNRTLANAIDSVYRSKLSIELAESEFAFKMCPKTDLGYIGGGTAGVGGTIGGGIEFSKKFSIGTFMSVYPYVTKDAHHYHSGVKAIIRQPILRGFGCEYTLSPVLGAKFHSRSAFRSAYAAGMDTFLRIITNLYEIAKWEEHVAIDKIALKRQKKFLDSIKIKERIGLSDSLDVYRAEIELKHTEDSLDNTVERLMDSKDNLKELLGIPLDQDITVRMKIDYQPLDVDEEAAIETALNNRVEVAQAADQIQENKRHARIAEKNILPDLNLVMDFSNIGRDEVFTDTFTYHRDSRWGIGFTTSTDWDRAAQKAAFTNSLLNVTNSERNLDQIRDRITLDVKKTIRNLDRTVKKIDLQQDQIKTATGELKLARLKFDRGRANNFDVIQAEKNLRNAESSLLNAIVEHKIGEFRLYAVIGLLADKPELCQCQ